MKKFIKYFAWIAAAVFAVSSCQEVEQPHEPGEPDVTGCYGVYFPTQAASGTHVYSPVQDPSVDITLKRTNTSGAISVPIKATYSEEGIFTLGEAAFADGQDETTFTVRFDPAKEGPTYKASFTIEDNQYASLYGNNAISLDFSVMRVQMQDFKTEDGSAVAKVTFTDASFWGEVHDDITIQFYEVDGVRYCTTVGGKLVGEGTEGVGPWGTGEQLSFKWYTGKKVTVDDASYQWIEVEPCYMGYDSANGPVYLGDYFWMRSDMGLSNGNYTNSYDRYTKGSDGYLPSYYDGHGGFIINAAYWIHGTTSWYGYKNSTPVGIAEGYLRVDYSFKAESDYSYSGISPISLTAGVDVASVKYAVYEGELTATQVGNKVAAIAAGTEESVEFKDFEEDEDGKYATLELHPETTGMYTFVAVAYDAKGNAQNNASVTFKHIAEGDLADHAVEVSVFTEDTPARYKNYHAYDSFAYGISGEDLTDVHVGLFKFDDVAKNASAYFDAVKKDAKGTYAVSADILDQINGEGGYYTVATGMPAKTNLVVLVWATNGDMEDVVYATYTTDRLPYVWNKLGTGIYTEDVAGGLYGIGPLDVECNVYEEATTPGLYMIDGYQKNYIALLLDPDEDGPVEDYEGELWRNSELVIDATDPENVFIELQDYGICLNSGDGFIDGLTSLYKGEPFSVGTLEDGVIAFPTKKGLLCTLNGEGYYYANQDGAFKLVLPAAAAPVSSPKAKLGKKNVKGNIQNSFYRRMETEVFERDPQPVKVAAKVSYARKSSSDVKQNRKLMNVR